MRHSTRRIIVTAAAVMAVVSLSSIRAFAEEKEKEENEVKVKMADVPAAVKATLEKEANGATLPDSVDKETDDGKVIYEADVKIDGTNYEIKTTEDGKLVSKKIDEEDEKGEHKEK